MITFKFGNLVEAVKKGEVTDAAHGCNCFHKMGSGVAVYINQLTKGNLLTADKQFSEYGHRDKLGSYTYYDMDNDVRIYNLYTQFNTTNDRLSYAAIGTSFRQLIDNAVERARPDKLMDRDVTIGIPLIGAVRGGGDWKQIYQIIVDELEFAMERHELRTIQVHKVQIVIYLLPGDEQAINLALPEGSNVWAWCPKQEFCKPFTIGPNQTLFEKKHPQYISRYTPSVLFDPEFLTIHEG